MVEEVLDTLFNNYDVMCDIGGSYYTAATPSYWALYTCIYLLLSYEHFYSDNVNFGGHMDSVHKQTSYHLSSVKLYCADTS